MKPDKNNRKTKIRPLPWVRSAAQRSTRFYVVAGEGALIPDVEFSCAHHGMSPARPALVGNFEPAGFVISRWSRIRQADNIVFAQQVEPAISISNSSLPDAAVPPDRLAGRKFHAGKYCIVETVQVSIDQHHSPVVVHHV